MARLLPRLDTMRNQKCGCSPRLHVDASIIPGFREAVNPKKEPISPLPKEAEEFQGNRM